MGTELNADAVEEHVDNVCASCGDDETIGYGEEVVLLQIVQPQVVRGGRYFRPVMGEMGDFAFDPYFFHFTCWENFYEDITEASEDSPPRIDAASPFHCHACHSGIREGERAGSFTLGEFYISQRTPNGERSARFHPNGEPELLCLYCLLLGNENSLEMWEELSEKGECIDCTQACCWRLPACDCVCHAREKQ